MDRVKCLIDVPELVVRIPLTDNFLTLFQIILHTHISSVLFYEQVLFELIDFIVRLVCFDKELYFVAYRSSFNQLLVHVGDIV